MADFEIPSDIRESLTSLAGDRFALLRELGQGGMATVYLADDRHLGRPVAIKVLHRHLIRDAEHCARFRREAESIARLDHPGMVAVYDLLEQPGQFLAIVMEYVPGPSLRQLLDDRDRLAPELAATVIIPVLEALEHAHQSGVIHRDLKPENILLADDDARPRLTDFGIAHVADRHTLTDTGAVIGSPAYMSPESITGDPVDRRSDLFAAGVVLYRMVTGRLPYVGKTPSAILREIALGEHRRADLVCEKVGRRFAVLLEQFLHMEPDERPSSASDAAELLRGFIDESLGDDRPDIGGWLQAPDAYGEQLEERLAIRLFAVAEKAIDDGDRRRALALGERLLAFDVDEPDASALLDRIHDDPAASRRLFVYAAAAIVVAATAGGAWLLWPGDEPVPDAPSPVAQSPQPAEPTEEATVIPDAAVIQAVTLAHARGEAAGTAHHLAVAATDAADTDDLVGDTTARSDVAAASSPPVPQQPTAQRSTDEPTDTVDSTEENEEDEEEETRRVSFRLVPASATLTVGDSEFDAIDASAGVELPLGSHTITAEGPGTEAYRDTIDVDADSTGSRVVVLHWKDGYIRLNTNRDALVWSDSSDSPQTISANDEHLVPVSFGPADEVKSKREVTLRVAPRDDLQNARERTVQVRPATETPIAITWNEN